MSNLAMKHDMDSFRQVAAPSAHSRNPCCKQTCTPRKRQRGFSLLEVMIALAIFAVTSVSLFTVNSRNANVVLTLESKTIAHWLAMNKMVELQNDADWPEVGFDSSIESMAGRDWQVESVVDATAEETMRRITIVVKGTEDGGGVPITQLIGFVGKFDLVGQ